MSDPARPHRGTMVDERAEVLANEAYPGHQHVLRLKAPEIARRARPGSFVHLRCAPALAMRRPMSIMRANPTQGTVDILFKAHGQGTAELAARQPGESLQVLGPIGVPFRQETYRRRPLLIWPSICAASPASARWWCWARKSRFPSACDPRPSWCRASRRA